MEGASKRGRRPAVHRPVELRGSMRSEEEAQAGGRALFARGAAPALSPAAAPPRSAPLPWRFA
ncbi:MAG TPA: hypothetical protein VMT70_21260 [Vicinamibacteria bacterium]|nr:hypothetical protein [Vicinamibacteria bacterium]